MMFIGMGEPPCPTCGGPTQMGTDGIAACYRCDHEKGVAVDCAVCGKRKAPRGRSAPMDMANGLCDWECPGYAQEPQVGDLWPGESRADFGYPRVPARTPETP